MTRHAAAIFAVFAIALTCCFGSADAKAEDNRIEIAKQRHLTLGAFLGSPVGTWDYMAGVLDTLRLFHGGAAPSDDLMDCIFEPDPDLTNFLRSQRLEASTAAGYINQHGNFIPQYGDTEPSVVQAYLDSASILCGFTYPAGPYEGFQGVMIPNDHSTEPKPYPIQVE